MTPYSAVLPAGEELPFQLEPTTPGVWMTGMSQEDWQRQRGTVIRLAIDAHHDAHGDWTLPCEIDVAQGTPRAILVSQSGSGGAAVKASGFVVP